MKSQKNTNEKSVNKSLALTNEICKVLSAKKAEDIVKINVSGKTDIADYFVIASARSSTQVKALSEYVEEAVEKAGAEIRRKEGVTDGRWAIIDCADVIVHIFDDQTRLFYHLERLWANEDNSEVYSD